MHDDLVKRLRTMADWVGISFLDDSENVRANLSEAADAIEELTAERDKYKRHSDSISKLPDCNTCGKKAKGNCEYMPTYGD